MDMDKFFQETDFEAATEKAEAAVDEIDATTAVEDEEGECTSCKI